MAKARKGTKFVTADGDVRIRLADITSEKPAKGQEPIKLTLYQILMGEHENLPTTDPNREVQVSSLNLKGLALIEQTFGGLEHIPAKCSMVEMIKLCTILVNQDLAKAEELSEDDVSRLLDGHRVALITKIIGKLLTPLPVAPTMGAKQANPASNRAGSASSGSLPKNTARSVLKSSGASSSIT